MATCGECAGRKYCIMCEGSGRDREDFGIGQCRHCLGHGYCPRCNGKGHDGTDFGVPGRELVLGGHDEGRNLYADPADDAQSDGDMSSGGFGVERDLWCG